MKLGDYKLIFIAVGLIGVLLIATPALAEVIGVLGGEQFSELYLLDPDHMAENYPYNIEVGQDYSVNVGVGNNLGSLAYYVLYVKLANQTDQMPNDVLGTPSSLQPLYEYRFSIKDNMNWERLLTFSVSNAFISGNNSQIKILQINGDSFNVDKLAVWDSNSFSFKYRLLFELWLYNVHTGIAEFNNRHVNLQLNLIQPT